MQGMLEKGLLVSLNSDITFNLITSLKNMRCVYVSALFVCSAVSVPGDNGKQELCGRCLCSRRSSVLRPRQCLCLEPLESHVGITEGGRGS